MAIRLIVDSSSDLSKEYAQEHGMEFIPMHITFGDEELVDGETIDKKTFYERLVSNKELPRTSMINSYEYGQVFERVKAAGDQGIVMTVSEKLSGTAQAARIAAEEYDHIFVWETGQAAITLQIQILYAQRLIEEGKSAEEILACLEEKKEKTTLVAVVDTLEFLKKGGRISTAAAIAGGVLKIKPVLSIKDGEVVVIGKARGVNGGNNMLTDKVREVGGIDFSMPYMLGYTGNDMTNLRQYIEGSRALWEDQVESLPITQIGCTIGTHAGPGAIAVAFFAI